MNTQVSTQRTWFSLSLLGGEYVLLGWYLAAHHVFWLIATLIVLLTTAVIWKKNPILEFLVWFTNQQVIFVIGISLLFSLIVALALIKPIILTLTLLPLFTLLYALFEMRTANFNQFNVFLWIVMVTTLGLGIGEAIDLFITPSMRY
ncbi:hypothetical protein H6G89_12450 [Oscillatoria sp. FACHB-1407]|uniref:hypothetical protein n=1 Tax=Oscillatoria sp. FACHB-1407 TaxID=2692847 RepID=UPI0016835540|nr:hypothetical protein [Oscillatoria sp. FACHB-1407]MBD2461859.1 hypothetical protein [Oscillatoria sp. FACHB-1407]